MCALNALTDEELMVLYVAGESSAFEELYRRHSARVYSYLLKKLGQRQEAEELLQSVFLKFHRSRRQYDQKFPVLQWLYVISKSAVLDFYRKEKRSILLADQPLDEDKNASPAEMSQSPSLSALEGLEALSSEQRQVVEWRYVDSLSFEEIATKLGKSQVGIRQTLSRAIKKLRSALTHKGSNA